MRRVLSPTRPADFFLFPKLKSSLKGHRFQTVEEIEENGDRRKFNTGLSRRPTKHAPERVPEM